MSTNKTQPESVRQRLLEAGKTCFPADDYHVVSTRRIADLADLADANVSMIRYYLAPRKGCTRR